MLPYKVMVVEDEPLILQNIIDKIHHVNPEFKVVYAAANGLDAWEHIEIYSPDLLITDIQMPVMNGLDLLARVKESYPAIECVILTGFNEFEYARKAMKIGIQEYLLKPLKPNQVQEVLETVGMRLRKRHSTLERNIIVSGLYGSRSQSELPSDLKREHFAIFLISLGHLCKQISDYKNLSIFQNCWEQINLAEILVSAPTLCPKWWVIDDKQPNQKFLILSCPVGQKVDLPAFGDYLLQCIIPHVHPLIVNICAGKKFIPYREIWAVSQKIRVHLEHHLRLARSSFHIEDTQTENPCPDAVPAERDDYQDILLNLISTNNRKALAKELEKLCLSWDESGTLQRSMEKQLFRLMEKSYHQFLSSSDAEILHLEYEFCERLALSPNLMGIFDFIMDAFDNLLQLEENDIYEPEELVRRIRTFIEQNYMTSISLETIAQSFHFDGSYLTKIFKKYEGETPLKYIIKLRIEKAKKLMETQPELSIKDICSIVGYYDQHYFSRIFKNITGYSPSEYRKLQETPIQTER
uniref:response regulator transcription factor n=1 Tax=Faecalicatena contorta TaxID=39482 RepID=UPI00359C86CB